MLLTHPLAAMQCQITPVSLASVIFHHGFKALGIVGEALSKLWQFIIACFIYFSTIVHKWKAQPCEFLEFLQWKEEEIIKMQSILQQDNVLNKRQCTSLVTKLSTTMHSIIEMITSTKPSFEVRFVVMELHCIMQKVRAIVNECGSGDWCHAALFQLNNREAFRELVFELKCCWEAVHDIYSTNHANMQNYTMCKDLNVATLKEVEGDEQELENKLESVLEGSKEYILAKHLLKRLKCDLQQVKGAEMDALEIPTDFQKPTPVKPMDDSGHASVHQSNFPKNTQIKEIGVGATGSVYESTWLGLPSATKKLKVPDDLSDFRKEVGILAGLSHSNLIKFFCCGIDEEAKELILVMELMEMSLTKMLEKLNKIPLSYVVAIDVMLQIGSGMWYLHDMHVAHLDLKPDNVMLSSMTIDGAKDTNPYHFNVKLIDYGTSKMEVQSKPHVQKPKFTLGTPRYMAPEARKESQGCMGCPFQADVWSFAMTCSQIISKKVPFHDTNNTREILQRIRNGDRPELPINCGELTKLIEECWREDPLQRPPFFDICKRLIGLKKMFMNGTYLSDMVPQFGGIWKFSPKISTNLEGIKDKTNHGSEKVFDGALSNDPTVVSLEDKLARVKYHLKEVNTLGIVGMGGIGKTTLAKAIFDDVKSTYDASCFVGPLKSRSSLDILCEILSKLDMGKGAKDLVDAHKSMEELLGKRKVLLILDDIEDEAQVDDIIPKVMLNGSKGSTLIITTRDWGAIRNRVSINGTKFDVSKLDDDAANTLFNIHSCWKASHLSPEFDDIRDKIVEGCKGLPLSLKVMGAYLRGRGRLRSWERALQRMQRGRSLDGDDDEIWNTLRVSFDNGLNEEEKNMFLDIACFFGRNVHPSGMSIERALHIWTNNNISPTFALQNLVHRALVTIEIDDVGDEILQMHDQLHAMGQMIAEKEYAGTRIWNANGLTSCLDVKKLEGCFYFGNGVNRNLFHVRQIQDGALNNLRLLSFHGEQKEMSNIINNIDGICSLVARSSNLKCFMIDICTYNTWDKMSLDTCRHSLTSTHLWRSFVNLRVLQLRGCSFLNLIPNEMFAITTLMDVDLQEFSNSTTIPKALGNLRSLTTLNLRECENLQMIPAEMGNLTSLTTLNLSGCGSLTTIPEEVGNVTSLITLNLSWCGSLTTIPKEVGNLSSLTTLDLSRCWSLTTVPKGVGNLTSLTTLDLSRCGSLTTIPEEVGNLASLTTLNLSDCGSLTTIPDGVGNLTSLTTLNLSWCESLTTIPEGVGNLTSLTTLNLSVCGSLTKIPRVVGNLTSLTFFQFNVCKSLTTIPDGVGKLTSLTTLNLSGCGSLTTIPEGLGNLTSLTTLNLSGCGSLTRIPEEVGNLTSLTTLNLNGCGSLTRIPKGVGNLASLTTLDLSRCWSLTTIPEGVGNLISLTTLDLNGCGSLTRIPEGVGNLTSLTTLYLMSCRSLTTIPEGVGNLTSLTTLDLSWCEALTMIPEEVGSLTSLTTLDLSWCKSLRTIPEGVGNLSYLITLNLSWCGRLTTIPEEVGNLISLTTLNLSDCGSLTTIPEGVGNLTSLTTLNLSGCDSLTRIREGVGHLASLTTLDVSGCGSLIMIPKEVGNLTSLTTLNLSECGSLTTILEGLGSLTSLTTLDLSWCKTLRMIPEEVGALASLTTVNLSRCGSLTKIPNGVGNLTSLTTLDLSWCKNLTTIPEGVGNLSSLTMLELKGCERLTTIPEEVGNLISLTTLNMSGCKSLTMIPEGVGNLASLTTLNLSRCKNLTTIPEEVGNLSSLTMLKLKGCEGLITIPEEVGNLISLTTLNMSGCKSLTMLPEGVGNLTSLTTLNLNGCDKLTRIQEWVGHLTSLTTLNLSGCGSLTTIPEGWGT